ncbi:hypothetical protein EHI8A_048370 [Entamoeba histolytica HM-1:IMSS-B]|uniref:TLDc domain-containing protein n=6 Tax=Entamoeba histolytica TaxID=5759 RepID=C4LX77_ENTH1|nr:hypothetical protein EHI_013070 [Entamoeba histolytica HM-1:IMSS]EMD42864.1 Hypothetical protein EHI5A_082600 [Entamoeba histolytica KU27]EMH76862.1 hypothetical protein EHI8A_048370 [Entamoeba histolytica HM-1:IMSS-B]EMS11009.1 hypothetical protein KM1_096350 [Entamoeba histolytica HM-3:IMSS]ENY63814.1 hypothetical protein EHI7A_048660 [Entamoeba histolytica HM-1:IMSS-A]GAT93344.1 hypothetical protein CL6EHI_013070 [Entamoeba histolytica]|eukprot:XP_656327.1 hypothetical protein EHI_013070 [Entamoeba histolytica HM-1:IMSS]
MNQHISSDSVVITISLNQLMNEEECDTLLDQLNNAIELVQSKKKELKKGFNETKSQETKEQENIKEVVIVRELEVHKKEYQYEEFLPKNDLGLFKKYQSTLFVWTKTTKFSVLFDTNKVGWNRSLFNSCILNKPNLLFLCFSKPMIVGLWSSTEIKTFNSYSSDPSFFLMKITEDEIQHWYRSKQSTCPEDAILVYSKHSTRWFGCYDCWIQATPNGTSTIYPEILSDFSGISFPKQSSFISSFNVERIVILKCI